MYFWERRNEIQDSDEKSAGCGILVKKEREYRIRPPLPDPGIRLRFFTPNVWFSLGQQIERFHSRD